MISYNFKELIHKFCVKFFVEFTNKITAQLFVKKYITNENSNLIKNIHQH